jgi:hypothetical protein
VLPLQKTPASPAPLSDVPRVHVVSPVHCTIVVPAERAESGTFRHALGPTQPISQSFVASHRTPSAHVLVPGPHRMVQVSALQLVNSPVHVASPVQAIAHAPASQLTPSVQEEFPLQSS